MKKKFAYFTFPNTVSEIRLKHEFVKRLPKFLYRWYIQRYYPFYVNDKKILDIEGYEVVVPITKYELCDSDLTDIIFSNILHELYGIGIKMAIPPAEYTGIPNIIRLADDNKPFIFLLSQAVLKSLKTLNKNIKSAEVFIIDGDYDLAETALYVLHNHVNYISVATDDPQKYDGICKDILDETGLNIQIVPLAKNSFKNKDIYIKTASYKNHFDYSYERGSAVIDISNDTQEFVELITKRNDILAFDGIELKCSDIYLSLYMLDITLYFSCPNYKKYLTGRYNLYDLDEILHFIESNSITISAYCQYRMPIDSNTLQQILKRTPPT